MKGYKTFIAAGLTVLLGVLGKHMAPAILSDYCDVIIAGLGLGFAVLRILTTSPVFQAAEAALARDVGLSPDAVAQISGMMTHAVATLDPGDKASLTEATTSLSGAVAQLTGHPLFQPATVDALTQLAHCVPTLLSPLTAAASSLPAAIPAPGNEALQAAPQPMQPTSDPAPAPVPTTGSVALADAAPVSTSPATPAGV